MGIEIHASAYALNCPGVPANDSVINYTTFYHYEIFNRSDTNYSSGYAGIYTDVDLGYVYDDYVGCDSANSFSFAYNGDNDDFGTMGYGLNPPMINFVLLKGPDAGINDSIDNNNNGVTDEPNEYNMMNSFMYFNNNNDAVAGNPTGSNDYYGYLHATWRNDVHLTYGGNGHGSGPGATIDSSNFMYSGEPLGNGWTETSGGNLPDDRRFISSSGPFYLPAHGKVSLDFAYVFTRNESGPNGANTSVATNMHDVMRVKHWFDTDSFPCALGVGISNIPESRNDVTVYPVPAKENVTIQSAILWKNARLELYDVLGNRLTSYDYPDDKSNLTLNTANLSNGLYFIKLSNDKNSVVKKLVIQ
jgi:hypothetical protein